MPDPREEFISALREIAYLSSSLGSPYDRVRLAEWVRCLSLESQKNDFECKIINPYAQLLRIQVRAGCLQSPFLAPPNTGVIPPLALKMNEEMLATTSLPTPGPTAPFMCRKSKDGHAYVAARQIPGKGVVCYLAVSTQDFATK